MCHRGLLRPTRRSAWGKDTNPRKRPGLPRISAWPWFGPSACTVGDHGAGRQARGAAAAGEHGDGEPDAGGAAPGAARERGVADDQRRRPRGAGSGGAARAVAGAADSERGARRGRVPAVGGLRRRVPRRGPPGGRERLRGVVRERDGLGVLPSARDVGLQRQLLAPGALRGAAAPQGVAVRGERPERLRLAPGVERVAAADGPRRELQRFGRPGRREPRGSQSFNVYFNVRVLFERSKPKSLAVLRESSTRAPPKVSRIDSSSSSRVPKFGGETQTSGWNPRRSRTSRACPSSGSST